MERENFIESEVSLAVFEFNDIELSKVMDEMRVKMINRTILYMTQANNKVSIISTPLFAESLIKKYVENAIMYKKNLSNITILAPKKTVERPGFLAQVTSKLSNSKINIFSIMTVSNKLVLTIDKNELFKAKKVLNI